MEWRQQTRVSCADAFMEAQRWIQEVTGKSFGCKDFRAALENGVLLCDLINQLKPGIIKRVNRLSTPIAGLDNVSLFLKACGKLGLNVSQLFHPGDLQDLSTRATLGRDESNRRLKNVLITIYWLGRKAHLDALYSGPQLNFKAFEGLLGLALSKALDEGSNVFVKDSWYPEEEECPHMRQSYKVDNSVDSLDSRTIHPNSEGCGSDAEAEQVFKMETIQTSVKEVEGAIPPPLLQRKQGVEEDAKGCDNPLTREYQIQVRPEKVQVNPGWIWSKSLSDIPMVYPVRKIHDANIIYDMGQDTSIAQEWNQEKKHDKCSVASKDGEAQWQDDLTKWKSRRRSTKSDQHPKSQDREHVINQMINGAFTDFEKNEVGRLLKRDQQSPHRNKPPVHSSSTSPSKSSSDQQPHTRALLVHSFATEVPFRPTAPVGCTNIAQTQRTTAAPMPASDGNILGEEIHFASLASDKGRVTTPSVDCPYSSQTQVKALGSPAPLQAKSELAQPENVDTKQISTLITTIQPNKTTMSNGTRNPTAPMSSYKELQFCTDAKGLTFCPDADMSSDDALENRQYQKFQEETQKRSSEPTVDQGKGQQVATVYKYLSRTGSWSSSASLPRGYRRSEGSLRLSSAITARPFGSKQSRVSSLPRLYNVDKNQGLLLESEKAESLSPPMKSLLKRQTASARLTGQYQPSTRQNPKQAKNNSTDQTEEVDNVPLPSFQSNGFHHQPFAQTQLLPQPYSNLRAHSKTSPLPSNASSDHQKVDHRDMRVSFTLKPNSRPDFGFQTHWDSTGVRVKLIQPGSPAELCQLCVDDEIVAVNGVEVVHMNYTQWKEKMTSSLQTGSLTMDIRRYGNKDWSSSEGVHPNQPDQSRMTLNLTAAAPVLIDYSDHHANSGISTDTTVRKAFNGQTDNVIPGKIMHGELAENHRTARNKDYNISKRDQRRADFFKRKGGSESAISDLQVPSLSPSSSSWSWNHEEDRRRQEKWQEEQERLLQEQYRRDQERLEAEWQRAQQDAMGELCMASGVMQNTFQILNDGGSAASTQPHVNGLTNSNREEEQSPDRDEQKEVGSKSQSNGQPVQKDITTEKVWAGDSCGFAQLSPAHRAKSLSTPALAGPHKQTRGDERKTRQSLSKVEQERQQILEEMKKRTQLLTDNSWIRQRSSSSYKEPVCLGAPLKRFESLDNLDTSRHSPLWTTTFSYPRPHSAAAAYSAASRTTSSRHSTGGISSHRNTSMDASHHGSVLAANDISEGRRLESRFESETGSHTVSPDMSDSSPLVLPTCDQHAVLQITE